MDEHDDDGRPLPLCGFVASMRGKSDLPTAMPTLSSGLRSLHFGKRGSANWRLAAHRKAKPHQEASFPANWRLAAHRQAQPHQERGFRGGLRRVAPFIPGRIAVAYGDDWRFIELDMVAPDLCIECGYLHPQQMRGAPLAPARSNQCITNQLGFKAAYFELQVPLREGFNGRLILQRLNLAQQR